MVEGRVGRGPPFSYHDMTAPIIPFYESQGIVTRVNGVGGMDEVTNRITTALA